MPRKTPKMKGKFPHYDCQIQTGVTLPRTPTGKAKGCKACKATFHVGDFTISESGTIILEYNGRVDESGGPTMWTNWYHGVGCFGFYADTLRDDKIRVGKLAKKLGLPASPAAALWANAAFQAEYDKELLKRRFSGFDGLPANEQAIVRTIMQKGAYAAGDPLVAVAAAAGAGAAAAPAAAPVAAAAAAGGVAGKKRKSAAAEVTEAEEDAEDAAASGEDVAEDEDDDAGGKKKKARASAASAASSQKKKPTAASRKKASK